MNPATSIRLRPRTREQIKALGGPMSEVIARAVEHLYYQETAARALPALLEACHTGLRALHGFEVDATDAEATMKLRAALELAQDSTRTREEKGGDHV